MKHILIDFENVQPEAQQLAALGDDCHIWLFLGKLQQKTLSVELCEALCRFGKNVHFVRVTRSGKNALDFYLAYYLGRISEQDGESLIYILSRDGGFDVLVEHLEENRQCRGIVRLSALEEAAQSEAVLLSANKMPVELREEIPLHKSPTLINQCVKKSVAEFIQPDAFRPTVWHNLQARLHSILQQELEHIDEAFRQEVVDAVCQKMQEKALLTLDGETNFVHYHLDSSDILERLVGKLKTAKPKTVQAAKNVLRVQAQIFYTEIDEAVLNDVLRYCGQQQILRIKGEKIEYAPFPLEIKIPEQPVIVSREEDVKIMQNVESYFKKCVKNKPGSRTALSNSLKSVLKISDKQIDKLINLLAEKKKFSISNTGKLTYL